MEVLQIKKSLLEKVPIFFGLPKEIFVPMPLFSEFIKFAL